MARNSLYTGDKPFKVSTGGISTVTSTQDTLTEFPGWGGVSVDNIRRTFSIGDFVNQLAPEQSLFFAYLSQVAKKPLDETVWKPMEYRPQWQRRNFTIKAGSGSNKVALTETTSTGSLKKYTLASNSTAGAGTAHGKCDYNNVGKKTATWDNDPVFLLANQVLRLRVETVTGSPAVTTDSYENFKVTEILSNGSMALESVRKDFTATTNSGTVKLLVYVDDDNVNEGQVVGSAFAEASTAPDGWSDQISDTEFYMQIFKTAVPLMSGSAQATRYRGFADEYQRIYTQHILSHKMDIEHAMLFGNGNYVSQDERYSWGIVPFIEMKGGKSYAINAATDGFDFFVDLMRDFFDYESGNSGQKLVLTSRSVIAWLTKMGNASSNSFVYNTLGMGNAVAGGTNAGTTSPYGADIQINKSKFAPVPITSISTAFGTMNFVAHPLFRGHAENIAAVVDMNNVAYRCLMGNGINRDTFVETNIQDNSVDGRKDQIITECGLEVLLPETHCLLKFTGLTDLISNIE